MRKCFEPPFRPGYSQHLQQLDDPVSDTSAGMFVVDDERFPDLIFDSQHGIQRSHWILQDHPEVLAAHGAKLASALG
jgi:hypothetical protein